MNLVEIKKAQRQVICYALSSPARTVILWKSQEAVLLFFFQTVAGVSFFFWLFSARPYDSLIQRKIKNLPDLAAEYKEKEKLGKIAKNPLTISLLSFIPITPQTTALTAHRIEFSQEMALYQQLRGKKQAHAYSGVLPRRILPYSLNQAILPFLLDGVVRFHRYSYFVTGLFCFIVVVITVFSIQKNIRRNVINELMRACREEKNEVFSIL